MFSGDVKINPITNHLKKEPKTVILLLKETKTKNQNV